MAELSAFAGALAGIRRGRFLPYSGKRVEIIGIFISCTNPGDFRSFLDRLDREQGLKWGDRGWSYWLSVRYFIEKNCSGFFMVTVLDNKHSVRYSGAFFFFTISYHKKSIVASMLLWPFSGYIACDKKQNYLVLEEHWYASGEVVSACILVNRVKFRDFLYCNPIRVISEVFRIDWMGNGG